MQCCAKTYEHDNHDNESYSNIFQYLVDNDDGSEEDEENAETVIK